jgi:hypothetical protein
MMSITSEMDAYDIAQEIRLERQVHKGAFLLLEGITDIKRFSIFMSERTCSIVNCYGRENLTGAFDILDDEGFLGIVGLADADFDRVLTCLKTIDGLIYSTSHDFDLDWLDEEILVRYLLEVGSREKLSGHGGASNVLQKLLENLKRVSLAKFINAFKSYDIKFSEIDLQSHCSGFSVNFQSYLADVFQRNPHKAHLQNEVLAAIEMNVSKALNLRQLTNGHDVHCLLGVCLRGELGERKVPQTWGREIESHVRLSFDIRCFSRSEVFRALRKWESDHAPYSVLADHLVGLTE